MVCKQALERADFRAFKIIIFRRTAKVQAAASEVHLQPLLYEPGKFLLGIQDAFCLLFCQKTIDAVSRCNEVDGMTLFRAESAMRTLVSVFSYE